MPGDCIRHALRDVVATVPSRSPSTSTSTSTSPRATQTSTPGQRPAPSTQAELARLLLCWLMLIVFVQSVAVAAAMVLGPLHQHRSMPGNAAVDVMPGAAPMHHAHGVDERHDHAPLDVSVVRSLHDDETAALAQAALGLVFAAPAPAMVAPTLACAAHVQHAAQAWAWATHDGAPARRPPRA